MHGDSSQAGLLSRIERLEKSAGRQRSLALVTTGMLVLLAFGGASSSGPMVINDKTTGSSIHITGSTINYVDSSGTVRMYVGLDKEGEPIVDMHGASGTRRLDIGLTTAEAPSLITFDSSGVKRSFTGEYSNGNFGSVLYDSAGTSAWSAP